MKLNRIVLLSISCCMAFVLFNACQKMYRPELGEIILDPDPPPYNPLKSFFAFEGNVEDEGESNFTATPVRVSYVPGITGQALRIDSAGYVLLRTTGDTVIHSNGFVTVPRDSIINLGSFTLSFWMNGTGPVQGGAQGLFSISNSTQFWGNLDLFLENHSNASDPTEAFLKIHMFNASGTGNGEQWVELFIPNALNKWTHIAVTYNSDNSQLSVYADGQPTTVNGRVLGGGNYGRITYNNFNGIVIGNHQFQTTPSLTNHGPQAWARGFNGALDQFRLYNRGLSAQEVQQLFTSKN